MMAWALFIFLATAPGPSAPGAVQAYEDGRIASALGQARAVLAQDDATAAATADARLVEAFALMRLGRAEEARQSLQQLAQQGPDLGPYVGYLRARAARAAQDCDDAVAAATPMDQASVFAVAAWAQAGECLVRRHDAAGVRAVVEHMEHCADANDPADQSQLDLLRARAEELSAAPLAARDLYRSILVDYPFTPAAYRARERLNLLRAHGVSVPPWELDELLPRAETERAAMHPDNARRTYGSVVAKSRRLHRADLGELAELGLVQLDIVEQKYAQALQRLRPVLAHTKQTAVRAQATFLRADLLARLGRPREALATSERAVSELPREPYTQVTAAAAAQLAYNAGDDGQARHFIDWLIAQQPVPMDLTYVRDDGAQVQTSSTQSLQDRGLWLLAWLELREHAAAERVDEILARIGHDSEFYEAALYWRARVALDRGDLDHATVHARVLVQDAPTSYYALLASDAINQASPACGVGDSSSRNSAACGVRTFLSASDDGGRTPARPQADAVDLKAALVLYEHGMHGEARRLLRLTPMPSLSEADRVLAAYLYRRCGEVHHAAVLTRQAAMHRQDPAVVTLAYPRPWAIFVQQAANEFKVPVELIYAIMREESAFNPQAVSPRQAFGLMQMIKPTADRLARKVYLRSVSTHRLFDPRTAIRLGTAYLATLMREMDGDLPAVIASYQAGERAVQRWRDARVGLRDDEFIEDIPLASTRSYVKKVLASYGVYRLLNGMVPEDAVRLVQRREPLPDHSLVQK